MIWVGFFWRVWPFHCVRPFVVWLLYEDYIHSYPEEKHYVGTLKLKLGPGSCPFHWLCQPISQADSHEHAKVGHNITGYPTLFLLSISERGDADAEHIHLYLLILLNRRIMHFASFLSVQLLLPRIDRLCLHHSLYPTKEGAVGVTLLHLTIAIPSYAFIFHFYWHNTSNYLSVHLGPEMDFKNPELRALYTWHGPQWGGWAISHATIQVAGAGAGGSVVVLWDFLKRVTYTWQQCGAQLDAWVSEWWRWFGWETHVQRCTRSVCMMSTPSSLVGGSTCLSDHDWPDFAPTSYLHASIWPEFWLRDLVNAPRFD